MSLNDKIETAIDILENGPLADQRIVYLCDALQADDLELVENIVDNIIKEKTC